MIFARWGWEKHKFTNWGVEIYCRENLFINHYIYIFTTFRYNKLFHIRITKAIYTTSKWELCKLVFYITRQLFCLSDWFCVICPLYWVFYLSIVSYCIVIPCTDVPSYWFPVNWCCFVYLDCDSCCLSNTFIDMYFICHFQQYFSYIVAVICH
jgi:hypothetical protein